ncbi:GNS1/SUR4 family protein [Ostertagia ostertagi]
MILQDFLQSLYKYGIYRSLCFSCHPHDVAAFWSLLFAISKIVELGDTMFIVLRKKPLIFLHYYHHAAVLIYTVHSGAEHAAPGRAFIAMNFLAHSVMYTYYTFTAYGIRVPKWVSMGVTTIQTAQMLAGVAVSYIVYRIKPSPICRKSCYITVTLRLGTVLMKILSRCQQSMANLYLAFIIYVTFAVLFLQFFYKAYIAKSKKSKTL